jgi:hypothetical protein
MIEIAPEEYWVECTWQEIKLYLFVLTIDGKQDWRLPSDYDLHVWINDLIPPTDDISHRREPWTTADSLDEEWYTRVGSKFLLIPVRDLKDD